MADKKKPVSDWEVEVGLFARDEQVAKGKDKITREEFLELSDKNPNGFLGVDYPVRVKFLKDNGYEVTRDNLINPNLSSKPLNK